MLSLASDARPVCKPGFGGPACDVCGGTKATYGPGTRPIGTECVECPGIDGAGGGGGGFGFTDPKGENDWYSPRVIAAIAATAETECIGEFTQVVDRAWNLEPEVRAYFFRCLCAVHLSRTGSDPAHTVCNRTQVGRPLTAPQPVSAVIEPHEPGLGPVRVVLSVACRCRVTPIGASQPSLKRRLLTAPTCARMMRPARCCSLTIWRRKGTAA